MPRFLLATEGSVDEVVLGALCMAWCELLEGDVVLKQFPARGIAQVLRLAPAIVRAAHFGYYDVLLIHADADATPDHVAGHDEPRCRLCTLRGLAQATLEQVGARPGKAPLAVLYAIPKQTTDAWLLWGRDDGDGREVEQLSRDKVKQRVFEGAKFNHAERARALVPALLSRFRSVGLPPPSLAAFHVALGAVRGT